MSSTRQKRPVLLGRPGSPGGTPDGRPRNAKNQLQNPIEMFNPRDNMYSYIAKSLYERILGEERDTGWWLVGWTNIKWPHRGILYYTGIATTDTARLYMQKYGMPVHKLPDGRPRAIPWELDLWMIKFCSLIEEEANARKVGTELVDSRKRSEYINRLKAKHGEKVTPDFWRRDWGSGGGTDGDDSEGDGGDGTDDNG